MEKETAVYVEDVTKSYQAGQVSVPVLNHISFTVYKGEMLAVVGDSGSGKTTLMNLLGALDIPDSGKIRIGKREISGMDAHQRTLYRRNSLGFIFQDYNLVQVLNVYENIVLPLQLALILADEPTGNLDSRNTAMVVRLMQALCKKRNRTTIMVTHNMQIAGLCDRMIHIRDGHVTQGGAYEKRKEK